MVFNNNEKRRFNSILFSLRRDNIKIGDKYIEVWFEIYYPTHLILRRLIRMPETERELKKVTPCVNHNTYFSFMNYIFPKCEIIDNQKQCFKESGIPDFLVLDGNIAIYIEFKMDDELLLDSQKAWFIKNKLIESFVIRVGCDGVYEKQAAVKEHQISMDNAPVVLLKDNELPKSIEV